jgi:SAM-dependent methyltransferase
MNATHDDTDQASLEALVETGLLPLQSLHPGGLALTDELAQLCGIGSGSRVLDVASGTGESACYVAQHFGASVQGVDRSAAMLQRAAAKAAAQDLSIEFTAGDAAHLPFEDALFDAVLCECTLCFLDKRQVLAEMARVVRSGGCVGMHDLCWQPDTPASLQHRLAAMEGERPETLAGWRSLFAQVGLIDIRAVDRSALKAGWMRDSRRQLGVVGQLRLAGRILRRWGLRGALRILQAERLFARSELGYAIVVGTKP